MVIGDSNFKVVNIIILAFAVSTPPQDLVAEYVNMEDMSSTALQLTWTPPLCDYGNRTGYTVCTVYFKYTCSWKIKSDGELNLAVYVCNCQIKIS